MDKINYQEYKINDEIGIASLFKDVFGESMVNIWNYYYKDSFKKPIDHNHHVIVVAKDGNDIVGACFIGALTFYYNGNLIKGGIVKDVMVHPS